MAVGKLLSASFRKEFHQRVCFPSSIRPVETDTYSISGAASSNRFRRCCARCRGQISLSLQNVEWILRFINCRNYELVPANAATFRLRTFAPWFLRGGKRNLAGLCVMAMRNDSLLVFFYFIWFSFSRCILPFFSEFFDDFDLPWRTQYMCFFFKARSDCVCVVVKHNRAKCRLLTLKNQCSKMIPVQRNYFLGFSKRPIHCSRILAGVSFSSLVRLAEQKKCYGRLPLVDAIMSTCLVSKYSAY